MDDLIVKRLREEATDIEIRQLEHWRAESSENERAYNSFIGLWDGTGEPEVPAVRPVPPLDEIIREGEARRTRGQARRAGFRSPWLAYGLPAAAVAALIFLSRPSDVERGSSTPPIFPVESSSGPGDVTTLGLSDGSIVRMMPETRLEFPTGSENREVVLEGKAFFAVATGSTPFVIRTRVGEVTVHGTRFELLTDGDELRLVVVEGRVRLEGGSGGVEVGPGQVAHLGLGSSPRVVDHADVWSMLDWEDGLLVFKSTPLSMVAEELGRHFEREVTIRDEGLGHLRITAWFEDESMEEVISAVCLVAEVRCEVSETEVLIMRGN